MSAGRRGFAYLRSLPAAVVPSTPIHAFFPFCRHVKNTSNTNVTIWAGRLWTLFEAGQPYRLDPHTLETVGLETLDGQLHPGLPLDMGSQSANESFAAFLRAATPEHRAAAQAMPAKLLAAGAFACSG